jgi:diguanylate cyclase (GGDEF)-like protein
VYELAEDVLALLEVRESDALAAWLGERLASLHPQSQWRALRIYPATASRIKDLPKFEVFSVADSSSAGAPAPAGRDRLLSESIAARRAMALEMSTGRGRLLATLIASGEVRYVVELSGVGRDTAEDERLRSLLAVTGRYYERLVEAEMDPLTRLCTRRVFQTQVETALRRRAAGFSHYFAIFDIDHFKRINDNYGHLFGDEILVHFAGLLRKTFRAADLLYRFGGEEFVVVFGVEAPQVGLGPLDRFRHAVETYEFPTVGRVTVSGGCVRINEPSAPTATLLDHADQALYYAKVNGRNRVCDYDALVAGGELKPKAAKADVTLF